MSGIPVHYESALVGTIEVSAEGPAFIYDPSWASVRGAFPVSLRIPIGAVAPPEDAITLAHEPSSRGSSATDNRPGAGYLDAGCSRLGRADRPRYRRGT